jgi:hypothetical protein
MKERPEGILNPLEHFLCFFDVDKMFEWGIRSFQFPKELAAEKWDLLLEKYGVFFLSDNQEDIRSS